MKRDTRGFARPRARAVHAARAARAGFAAPGFNNTNSDNPHPA